MVSLIEHTVRIDNRLYEFQKEKKSYNGPKKDYKYRGNEGRKRTGYSRENRWSDPMELDASFKTGGRPPRDKNPKTERQVRERLCFNCDKPGHMARDCRQPKKEQGRKPFGKPRQLNATQQGRGGYQQIAMTSNNEYDWDVDAEDLPMEESGGTENEELTLSESHSQRKKPTRPCFPRSRWTVSQSKRQYPYPNWHTRKSDKLNKNPTQGRCGLSNEHTGTPFRNYRKRLQWTKGLTTSGTTSTTLITFDGY
jgi:hypothetical protein